MMNDTLRTKTPTMLGWLTSGVLAIVLSSTSAFAVQSFGNQQQNHAQRDRAPGEREPEPTRPRAVTIEALDEIRPGQEPLLREGSVLMQVRGRIRYVPEGNQWQFLVTRDDAALPGYRLTILPNRYLSEIEQVLDASEGSKLVFELSGRVYVYRHNNYLLVTSPPRIVSDRLPAGDEADETERDETELDPDNEVDPDDPNRPRGARDIMEELEGEAGDLARALPRDEEDAMFEDERDEVVYREEPLAEGTSVIQRRGRITRDAGGTLRFVFDADASGLADPPMTLLPCLMLERLERFARRNERGTPVLISGLVFTYEGRNYLLPTQFTQPRERTTLMP